MNPVIRVDNVWKRYTANEQRPSLRQDAMHLLQRWMGLPSHHLEPEPFWALRGVSFTVDAGESVAIIGRNGAGKTTLLRLLADISEPTAGTIGVQGHSVALLGLGAGFDNERTGRENIYLNAAIYGIAPREVAAIIEPILVFAELGDFIDRPIKRYSSGMRARLAFSIAIHILPDIIMLDEILSVGDAAFQIRCLERIDQMKSEGRTILLVSHSNSSIRQLCERAIWLNEGRIMQDGATAEVLANYTAMLEE